MLIFFVTGCASLHEQVFSIKKGDSRDSVIEALGTPDSFQHVANTDNGEILIYSRKRDYCQVGILDSKVLATDCHEDENYVSSGKRALGAFGTALQGAGNGITNASQNNVNCYSYPNGSGGFYTNCH